jgi:hypothetical protein
MTINTDLPRYNPLDPNGTYLRFIAPDGSEVDLPHQTAVSVTGYFIFKAGGEIVTFSGEPEAWSA